MRRDNRIFKRWLPVVVVLLAAAVLTAVFLLNRDPQSSGPPGQTGTIRPPNQTQPVPQRPTLPEMTQPTQTDPAETTEPAQTEPTIPEEPTEDFEPWIPPEEEDPEEKPQTPEPVDTDKLQCRQYARFSGQYVEDGRDELVENVAAILVTNKSDQFLDLATLTYDIDGEIAEFIVTGLPAGRSAWVMEATRMVVPNDAVFTFVETVTSFRDNVVAGTEDIALYADANMLTAVNNTGKTLEDVFVYYKKVHSDGNFFGGITYRVDFGTLEPGEPVQTLAGHFSLDDTEIVRIGWADQ